MKRITLLNRNTNNKSPHLSSAIRFVCAVGNATSVASKQRAERQKTERQKTENRKQKTEGRRQRGRKQRAEGREQSKSGVGNATSVASKQSVMVQSP